MAVAGRNARAWYPQTTRPPLGAGASYIHEGKFRYRGAGWEAIRSHLDERDLV
jgi:hypothetical protein